MEMIHYPKYCLLEITMAYVKHYALIYQERNYSTVPENDKMTPLTSLSRL